MTLLKVAEPVYVLIVLHRLIDRYRQERDFCLHLETEYLFLLKFTSRLNSVIACIVGGADAFICVRVPFANSRRNGTR